jgi:glycerophosphoryl diester phosphodiesterase
MKPYAFQKRQLDWLIERPIAHRGLHDKTRGIIENTASAFAGAIAGNYAIECDLQITSDGEAVVFHDDKLERLTEGSGLVKAQTFRQLQTVTLKNCADKMQSLSELLEQVDGAVPLVIELKSHWDGDIVLAKRALTVLEHYPGPYCLMSFDPDLVAAVAEFSPNSIRGITADQYIDPSYDELPLERRLGLQRLDHLAATQPDFISFYFRELPYAPVHELRKQGMPIITWTIRNAEQAAAARHYSDQITFEGYAA